MDETGPESAKSHRGQELVHEPVAALQRPALQGGKPTERAKQEADYGRRGKGYVFGAFQPADVDLLTELYQRRTTVNWVDSAEKVERWLPPEIERVYAMR